MTGFSASSTTTRTTSIPHSLLWYNCIYGTLWGCRLNLLVLPLWCLGRWLFPLNLMIKRHSSTIIYDVLLPSVLILEEHLFPIIFVTNNNVESVLNGVEICRHVPFMKESNSESRKMEELELETVLGGISRNLSFT